MAGNTILVQRGLFYKVGGHLPMMAQMTFGPEYGIWMRARPPIIFL